MMTYFLWWAILILALSLLDDVESLLLRVLFKCLAFVVVVWLAWMTRGEEQADRLR